MRLVSRGPWVGARISNVDGKWSACIDGEEKTPRHEDPVLATGVLNIWHSGQEITKAEYKYKVEYAAWAKANKPDDPAANPTKAINLNTLPPVYQSPE